MQVVWWYRVGSVVTWGDQTCYNMEHVQYLDDMERDQGRCANTCLLARLYECIAW